MRLLLLFPNLILLAVAGYNLFLDFNAYSANSNYLVHKLLHSVVLVISLIFIGMVLKPMFPAYKSNFALSKTVRKYFVAVK